MAISIKWIVSLALGGLLLAGADPAAAARKGRIGIQPNIIYISCDNLGYGDVEPFGSKLHKTPHLSKMARQGMKFTHYYSASGVCTSSRAALMTGCYPCRVSMDVTDGAVLRPVSPIGLHPDEMTVAEVLKSAGYATAIFGKWHLGDQPIFLPTQQGFDYYLGIPYSDDMTPRPTKNWPELPLMENEKVIEAPTDRDLLTKRLTEAAVSWIRGHRQKPFFLYFAQCMPGSTRAPYASAAFKGKSRNGPWGDSVEELDWSVGEILKVLAALNLDETTLVIWTSDNGAPRRTPPQGSNGPLAGWGYTTAEGGMRVPCIMRWPRRIPAGSVCSELSTMMDMLPTFAKLAGADKLPEKPIDGKDIVPLMMGRSGAKTPHQAFYYYRLNQLQAVRSGAFKMYVDYQVGTGEKSRRVKPRLYNVVNDPGETADLAEKQPRKVAELMKTAGKARKELGDRDQPGTGVRPSGLVKDPVPQRLTSE